MMINQLNSFGIVLLIENTIILMFIADMARRVSIKLRFIRHPHVYWNSGMIFLAYLLCIFANNMMEFYTCYVHYLIKTNPIAFDTVVARVSNRSFTLAAKFLLWYYILNGGLSLLKHNKSYNNEPNQSTN